MFIVLIYLNPMFYFTIILFNLIFISCNTVQEAKDLLFDTLDYTTALSILEKNDTSESHVYQYFIKHVILNDTENAVYHLIASQGTDYYNLIYAHSAYFSILFNESYENNIQYYESICKGIYELYIENKTVFRTKRLFHELGKYADDEKEAEHLTVLIRAGNTKAGEDLILLLKSGRVQPGKHEKILKKLAIQGNAGAMGILGAMYYDGWCVDKCINTAMHYFTEGARKGDGLSYNGMGNIYRDKQEYQLAKDHYIKACNTSLADAEYNLFMFYRTYYNAEEMAMDKLLLAASKGYLPASYTYAEKLIQGKNYRRAIMYLAPMTEYAPVMNELHDRAEKYFIEKKYDSCLLVLLLASEMGSSYSLQNIVYMAKRIDSFTLFDKNRIIYQTLFKLAHLGYKSNIVELGDCYYYGIGIEKSYSDAFAFYLSAALEKKPEGTYSLAYLYEHGLGVEKDLLLSLKYISQISYLNEKMYLLVWYISGKLIIKIGLYYLFNSKVMLFIGLIGLLYGSVKIIMRNKRK